MVNKETPRTIPQMFEGLYQSGALATMLRRTIDCENHYGRVEFATRGLYWEKVDWSEKRVDNMWESITDRYLQPTISLHATRRFTSKWANGETAYLDLETGKAETF